MWFRNIKEISEDLANTETLVKAFCISFFTDIQVSVTGEEDPGFAQPNSVRQVTTCVDVTVHTLFLENQF